MSDVHPAPEDTGGWAVAAGTDELRELAGMHRTRVDDVLGTEAELSGSASFGVVVVRHGRIAGETYARNVSTRTRFDVWSCTKSFTSLAWGILLAEHDEVGLDTRAYSLIPEPGPLSDPRKADITLRHLLSMTSGIPGETAGLAGIPADPAHGAFEYALGHAPNRLSQWAATLRDAPGRRWDYSDPAFAHLAPAFAAVAGREIADVVRERVFGPLGIRAAWDLQGGGGFRGPHTNAHTGLHLSARDLARIGLLLLREGAWEGRQLVPQTWIATATAPSQELNPNYGFGFWTNGAGTWAPRLPRDTFALAGFASNRCYVVPSADLVIARTGTGPHEWHEERLVAGALGAIL